MTQLSHNIWWRCSNLQQLTLFLHVSDSYVCMLHVFLHWPDKAHLGRNRCHAVNTFHLFGMKLQHCNSTIVEIEEPPWTFFFFFFCCLPLFQLPPTLDTPYELQLLFCLFPTVNCLSTLYPRWPLTSCWLLSSLWGHKISAAMLQLIWSGQ